MCLLEADRTQFEGERKRAVYSMFKSNLISILFNSISDAVCEVRPDQLWTKMNKKNVFHLDCFLVLLLCVDLRK